MASQLTNRLLTVSQSPSRRFQTEVTISQERAFQHDDRCNLNIYITHMSNAQMERMKEIVTALPSLVKTITEKTQRELWSVTKDTLGIASEQLALLRAEAWEHERWHAAVLQDLPCFSVEEAQERCDRSPWDVDELLVLPHAGCRYVPAFQFLEDGSPSPAWATLMGVLLSVNRFDQWYLFAWLVRPDSLLDNQSPLFAIDSNPKRVLSMARLIDREGTL